VFANPVHFWGEANPNFFKGTAVEAEAALLLTRSYRGAGRGIIRAVVQIEHRGDKTRGEL
jgi:hypothetical protein